MRRLGRFRNQVHVSTHDCRRKSTNIATADVCIIGAGVIGCSIALELSRQGVKTINVDAYSHAGMGSTGYSSGIVRMYYSTLDGCKMAMEGYHYWKHWREHIGGDDERGMVKLRECGSVLLRVPNSTEFLDGVIACYDELGIPYEEWDATQIQEKLKWNLSSYGPPKRSDNPDFGIPSTSLPDIEGGLWLPQSGYISDPMLATQNLQFATSNAGGSFIFNNRVVEMLVEGGNACGVKLGNGSEIHAPVVVNAAGPESCLLTKLAFDAAKQAGIDNDMELTTRAMRQEVAYLQSPPDMNYGDDGVVTADFDTGCYFRPEVGNKVLVGGLEPECDAAHHDYAEQQLSEESMEYTYRTALRMPTTPLPGASDAQGIVALYDVTEDWTPIYDKSSLPGYYMAIGTSGNQFKNAGPVGKLMAAIIQQVEAGHDHDTEPVQVPMEMTKVGVIDTSTFSRLRSAKDIASVIG